MKCPLDETQLVMTDRQGIEIDYCPQCRGVWLDRGELDKLIERSQSLSERPLARGNDRPHRYDDDDDDHRHRRGRKRESFLGELFDF